MNQQLTNVTPVPIQVLWKQVMRAAVLCGNDVVAAELRWLAGALQASDPVDAAKFTSPAPVYGCRPQRILAERKPRKQRSTA